jgi:hypothetical protein
MTYRNTSKLKYFILINKIFIKTKFTTLFPRAGDNESLANPFTCVTSLVRRRDFNWISLFQYSKHRREFTLREYSQHHRFLRVCTDCELTVGHSNWSLWKLCSESSFHLACHEPLSSSERPPKVRSRSKRISNWCPSEPIFKTKLVRLACHCSVDHSFKNYLFSLKVKKLA